MNKILITLAALALTLTACGQNNKKEMKTLVAYFSATGTTKGVAEKLAEALEAQAAGLCRPVRVYPEAEALQVLLCKAGLSAAKGH